MKLTKTIGAPGQRPSEVEGRAAEYTGWTLTSGKRLEEFAQHGGFLAPLLLMTSDVYSSGDRTLTPEPQASGARGKRPAGKRG